MGENSNKITLVIHSGCIPLMLKGWYFHTHDVSFRRTSGRAIQVGAETASWMDIPVLQCKDKQQQPLPSQVRSYCCLPLQGSQTGGRDVRVHRVSGSRDQVVIARGLPVTKGQDYSITELPVWKLICPLFDAQLESLTVVSEFKLNPQSATY